MLCQLRNHSSRTLITSIGHMAMMKLTNHLESFCVYLNPWEWYAETMNGTYWGLLDLVHWTQVIVIEWVQQNEDHEGELQSLVSRPSGCGWILVIKPLEAKVSQASMTPEVKNTFYFSIMTLNVRVASSLLTLPKFIKTINILQSWR